MDNPSPSLFNLGTLFGGGSLLTALGWRAFLVFKADRRKARVDEAADELRDSLKREVERFKVDMDALTARCDRFASERNAAAENAARLTAQVEALRQRNDDLIHDRKNLRLRVDALERLLAKATGAPTLIITDEPKDITPPALEEGTAA